MKTVIVFNKTTNELILDKVHLANSFLRRFKGLIGKRGLVPGEALLIRPCSSVHSFHMKFLFDVAFIDENNKVIYIIHSMKPWKCSPVIKKSKYVIETAGDYLNIKLKVDDEVEIL